MSQKINAVFEHEKHKRQEMKPRQPLRQSFMVTGQTVEASRLGKNPLLHPATG